MALPELDLKNFEIDASGELDKVSDGEKEEISDMMASFLKRNKTRFNEAHLHLHIKEHDERFRNKALMYSKMRLNTDRGNFNSSDDDWGAVQSVKKNLEHLQAQVDKKFGKMKTRTTIRKQSAESVLQ